MSLPRAADRMFGWKAYLIALVGLWLLIFAITGSGDPAAYFDTRGGFGEVTSGFLDSWGWLGAAILGIALIAAVFIREKYLS